MLAPWLSPVIAQRNPFSRAGSAYRVSVRIALPLQKAERHERVEEIARRTRMKTRACVERLEALGSVRQLGEHPHLDGTEQRLRRPERKTGLQNLVGRRLALHDGSLVCVTIAGRWGRLSTASQGRSVTASSRRAMCSPCRSASARRGRPPPRARPSSRRRFLCLRQ